MRLRRSLKRCAKKALGVSTAKQGLTVAVSVIQRGDFVSKVPGEPPQQPVACVRVIVEEGYSMVGRDRKSVV